MKNGESKRHYTQGGGILGVGTLRGCPSFFWSTFCKYISYAVRGRILSWSVRIPFCRTSWARQRVFLDCDGVYLLHTNQKSYLPVLCGGPECWRTINLCSVWPLVRCSRRLKSEWKSPVACKKNIIFCKFIPLDCTLSTSVRIKETQTSLEPVKF